jgi:hypothetical protein
MILDWIDRESNGIADLLAKAGAFDSVGKLKDRHLQPD